MSLRAQAVAGVEQQMPALLERVPGTKEEKQEFFAARHRVRVPKTDYAVMWAKLEGALGRLGGAEAVFDLVLARAKPRLLEALRQTAAGGPIEFRATDPKILDILFFQNGKPKKLALLLVEHMSGSSQPLPAGLRPARLAPTPAEASTILVASRTGLDASSSEQLEWFDRQTRYKRGDRLGEGGMGIVYRAIDTLLSRDVAVKIIIPQYRKDEVRRERFEREVRAQSRLRHPNVLPVYDRGKDFYVAELCTTSLDVAIRRGPMRVEDALRVVSQCCDGLGAAHGQKVIHRDVKPSNVLLDAYGTAKVADFGLCKIMASELETLTNTGMAGGTARYTAPEQWQDFKRADHRADIYSLAVVLHDCLLGKSTGDVRSAPSQFGANCSPTLDEVLHRALQLRPEDRHQAMSEFKDALLGSVGGKQTRVST